MGKKYVHDLSYCSDLLTLVVKSKDHGALIPLSAAPCHKAQIITSWFLKHNNDFPGLKWPLYCSTQSTTEMLHINVDVRLSCQYGSKSLMNVSSTSRIRAAVKTKGYPTQQWQGVPKFLMSVCTKFYGNSCDTWEDQSGKKWWTDQQSNPQQMWSFGGASAGMLC